MKVVITAQSGDPDAKIDPRFGRAKFFIVADTDGGEFTAVDNNVNLNAAQGAGIQSASNVAELGAEAVITGHVGPKAFRVLQAAGVKVFCAGDAETVSSALGKLKSGALKESEGADVEGHWI